MGEKPDKGVKGRNNTMKTVGNRQRSLSLGEGRCLDVIRWAWRYASAKYRKSDVEGRKTRSEVWAEINLSETRRKSISMVENV